MVLLGIKHTVQHCAKQLEAAMHIVNTPCIEVLYTRPVVSTRHLKEWQLEVRGVPLSTLL